MKSKIYVVDAFADKSFNGNPAAVCPLEKWLPNETMQKIASENNLSETAFFVKSKIGYDLKWFTPEREIDLCGHGTLASAFVIFNYIEKDINEIKFQTLSGEIIVRKDSDLISMEFPIMEGIKVDVTETIIEALGVIPIAAYENRDLMLVLQGEEDVKYLQPNMELLKTLNIDGIIVTAKGHNVDFVTRFFIPDSVIQEDPVTGSAQCTLVPYWSKRLNKVDLVSKQLSKRTGILYSTKLENKVKVSGTGTLYLTGEIYI